MSEDVQKMLDNTSAFTREEKLVILNEVAPEKLSSGMRGLLTALRDLEYPLRQKLANALPAEYTDAVNALATGDLNLRAQEFDFAFAEGLAL